jgi:aminoacrylate hydrolase
MTKQESTVVELPDGARLAVTATGRGHDLVLLSGLSGTAAFWDPLVPSLAQRFRVIRFDQRGIGESSRGTEAVDIARLARDLGAVLERLATRAAILVGHSTGGAILQELALERPSYVGGLVLSGTWARPSRYMTELFQRRSVLLGLAPREYAATVAFLGYPPDWLDANWPRYEAMLAAAPATADRQKVMAERIAALLAFDRSGDVGRITAPTLIVGAEDDLIVPAFLQRDLAKLMPRARLQMLATGGHFFPVTRQDEFTATLLEWIRAQGW